MVVAEPPLPAGEGRGEGEVTSTEQYSTCFEAMDFFLTLVLFRWERRYIPTLSHRERGHVDPVGSKKEIV